MNARRFVLFDQCLNRSSQNIDDINIYRRRLGDFETDRRRGIEWIGKILMGSRRPGLDICNCDRFFIIRLECAHDAPFSKDGESAVGRPDPYILVCIHGHRLDAVFG